MQLSGNGRAVPFLQRGLHFFSEKSFMLNTNFSGELGKTGIATHGLDIGYSMQQNGSLQIDHGF